MTRDESRRLYVGAGGPDDHCALDWEHIHREMEQLVSAKSDCAAGRMIAWWGCWDRQYTATAFARRVRQAWADMHLPLDNRSCQ